MDEDCHVHVAPVLSTETFNFITRQLYLETSKLGKRAPRTQLSLTNFSMTPSNNDV